MKILRIPTLAWAAALVTTACTGDRSGGSADKVLFREEGAARGVDLQHTDGSSGRYYIVETLASGVVLFDFDGDGDLDLYFPNGRPLPPAPSTDSSARNALYENDGRGRFRDVTELRGVPGTGFASGAVAGDIDGDGDLDLYVCQYGSNVLYRNDGADAGYSFSPLPAAAGADDARFSAGATFFDMDRDGDLDLYVTNYCVQDFASAKPCLNNGVPGYCAPAQYAPAGDSLFRNRGDGTFEDVTEAAGISAVASGRGMGVTIADFDDDGWPDLYVANDGSENFLWRNRRDGTFENVGLEWGMALSVNGDEQGSMGVDVRDVDGDGFEDVFVTNYQKQLNAFYLHESDRFYVDSGMGRGLGETCLPMVSWGTKFFDFDHDGDLDLFIANGHLEDQIDRYDQSSTYRQQNQLFENRGDGSMQEVTDTAGPGLRELRSSRGAAFGDLDGDGDLDIVVCNSRERPSVLINDGGNRGAWILLELRGVKNRHAIGARVSIEAGELRASDTVRAGASYLSQNSLRLHFGLGTVEKVDRVRVRWPNGKTESFGSFAARSVHVLHEGRGRAESP